MSKAKKAATPLEEKGNPAFNLADAEPVQIDWQEPAVNVITPEDIALDRELERLAMEQPLPDVEPAPPEMKKAVDSPELLSSFVDDYRPATTIRELEDQVHLAKVNGADSVECSMALGRYYVKDGSLETVGYFMFRDIKVYIEGYYERAQARDTRRMITY